MGGSLLDVLANAALASVLPEVQAASLRLGKSGTREEAALRGR